MTSRRSSKSSSRISLTSLGALSLALAFTSCAGQGDVDRTQPDKIDKAIFVTASGPKIFYWRQTYVGVPPTSNWAFEGTMTDMQKVRFEVTEKYLIGYRANDYAPGSQNAFTTANNNNDTPVVMYSILSHFDVKREYNPGTGEQTNVISENTTDRPWHDRQFMRVDWSVNHTEPPDFMNSGDQAMDFFAVKRIPNNWHVSEADYANPEFGDRPIVTSHYIDFVQKVTATPDFLACSKFYPFVDDGGPWNCGDAELKIRSSFREVTPSTYEPLDYPDNYPILDDKGNAIQLLPGGYRCTADQFQQAGGQYNGNDCSPAQVGGFSKFGFFRTVVQTYDRKYGQTEVGRKYFANRWNIWDNVDNKGESLINADGTVRQVPLNQRQPKPIVYYTNVEFPDDEDLLNQAKQVTADWSNALKKTLAGMLATEAQPNGIVSPSQLDELAKKQPEMVVLKPNSCNVKAVNDYLSDGANAKVADVVKSATGLGGGDVEKGHLTQVCSIMEATTQDLADSDAKKFTWQRNGDLRYSFFHWVDRYAPSGPLGYGPSSADPQTGEIISAGLYNYGAALDTYAQMSADAVELLNGTISPDDLLSGKTITDVIRDTQASRARREATPLTPEARVRATTMLRGGSMQGKSRLIPFPGGQQGSKLDAIKGTPLEKAMMTPDILAAMLPESKPGETLSPDQFAKASPVNWMSPKAKDDRLDRFRRFSQGGCVFLGEFADDAILGLALELKGKGLSGDALFRNLRTLIFRGLADHEMGHTMGLRHNFSGSTDALNYHDNFWKIRSMPKETWNTQKLSEFAYSTVMDYGSRFNSDVVGLGKYDLAAIRFGYGGLVDVMPAGAVNANESGAQLEYDLFVQDYSKLPQLVGGEANLQDGGVLRYSTLRTQLAKAYAMTKPNQGGTFVTSERPYKFCSDEYVGNLDCKPWDYGANQREIVDDTIDRFKNYFVFNAFKRGRLNWTIDGYLQRLMERYFARYTEAYQFFYFYGDAYAGTDLADDLLMASVDSINALGEVLQTPEPGEHCPTTVSPDVMVLPSPTGSNACLSGQPAMNIQIPDGKPYFINFSDDYYYRITRAGSLYEKLGALMALTTTDARFYRVDTFADSSKYSINYYSIFKDEMLNLLSGIIRNDPASYGGYVPDSGDLKGLYQPTPVVDLNTWGAVKPGLPDYLKPGAKRVDTPVNKTIRYYALGLALSNLDSSWDSTLDVSNYLAVTVKGSKEDVNYAPGTTVLEYSHPQSGLVYRSPQLDAARPGIGAQVVQELIDITGEPGKAGTLPSKFGRYRDQMYPNWYTAKKAVDDAKAAGVANTDTAKAAELQKAYSDALSVFQSVDYLVAYRTDLLNDLRLFRSAFGY